MKERILYIFTVLVLLMTIWALSLSNCEKRETIIALVDYIENIEQ